MYPLSISCVLAYYACVASVSAIQSFAEQPRYQEVNPFGNLILPCVVNDMLGQCRWEKDGSPVGMFDTKYEWAGNPETGDCSLRILNAELEYDDGVWQCQVTPSSFKDKDALISEGAQLVVRGKRKKKKKKNIFINKQMILRSHLASEINDKHISKYALVYNAHSNIFTQLAECV